MATKKATTPKKNTAKAASPKANTPAPTDTTASVADVTEEVVTTEENKATETAIETEQKPQKKDAKLHVDMKPYVAAYPKEKAFLIATDGQVFLVANKQDAVTHQKFIDVKQELVTYTVDK